jgi:hypothetical protein
MFASSAAAAAASKAFRACGVQPSLLLSLLSISSADAPGKALAIFT